jgi:ketosteroid isomerase-like protein
MSRENVELVEKVYVADELETVIALFAPDIKWDMSDRVFNPHVYRGRDGVRQWQRELDEVWSDWRNELESIADAGDKVVAISRAVAVGEGSGVQLSERWAQVWTVRDGKLASMQHFRDPAKALESVGLSE